MYMNLAQMSLQECYALLLNLKSELTNNDSVMLCLREMLQNEISEELYAELISAILSIESDRISEINTLLEKIKLKVDGAKIEDKFITTLKDFYSNLTDKKIIIQNELLLSYKKIFGNSEFKFVEMAINYLLNKECNTSVVLYLKFKTMCKITSFKNFIELIPNHSDDLYLKKLVRSYYLHKFLNYTYFSLPALATVYIINLI